MVSENKKTTILAHQKGYRIVNGILIGPKHNKIKCSVCGGYLTFRLWNGEKYGTVRVHHLAAYQKFGDKILSDDIEIRHLDGKKNNNCEENIDIGTASDNAFDQPKNVRLARAKHAASFNVIYDWVCIEKDRIAGMSYGKLMKKYDIKSKGSLTHHFKRTRC